MEKDNYVIGADFGSDSVRCIIVSARDGHEESAAVARYPRWTEGLYCNPREFRYRQHPLDYLEALEVCIREALSNCDSSVIRNISAISFDTTASTPAITDREGTPLALLPEFRDDPDAMFMLWKDHTAIEEADAINSLAHRWHTDYTKYSGGTYSCEWSWSKVLHVLKNNEKIASTAYSWVEQCDWISGVITGRTKPEKMARSRCVAGHKAMWNEEWDGLPSENFLNELSPLLGKMRNRLYRDTYTCDNIVGCLTPEWASRLGLSQEVKIGIGAIDCHIGAVGAGITPGTLVKVMGTSTCDIAVAGNSTLGNKAVRGICGQVDGSVIPGLIGMEAGQAAFGDIYAWFARLMSWPMQAFDIGNEQMFENRILPELEHQANAIAPTEEDPVASDWFNGRRTPDADQRLRGTITGLTLATSAPEIFKSLVEATAFGARAINERFIEEGIPINEVVAIGGIAKKSKYVMQVLSDVLGIPIKVSGSDQACALGAAMYAAVISGEYQDISEAQIRMSSGFSAVYKPDAERHETYNALYRKYGEFLG